MTPEESVLEAAAHLSQTYLIRIERTDDPALPYIIRPEEIYSGRGSVRTAVEAEREACAKVAEGKEECPTCMGTDCVAMIAKAIRARG